MSFGSRLRQITHKSIPEEEAILGWRTWWIAGDVDAPRLQSTWDWLPQSQSVWPPGRPAGPATYGYFVYDKESAARGKALTVHAWGAVRAWGLISRGHAHYQPGYLAEFAYPVSVEVPMNLDAVVYGDGPYFPTETWVPENADAVMRGLRAAYPGVEFTERWYSAR